MKKLLTLCCIGLINTSFTNGQGSGKEPWFNTPEELIRDIYSAVSAKDSDSVDWTRIRSMFIDEAVVILRTTKSETKQFTADGFIQDFKDFYQYPAVKANGFVEKILGMKSMVYIDIAFIAAVYSAAIVGIERPATHGVDLWLLRKKDGLWKIVSVVNEVIPEGQELPDEPDWKF